LARQRAAESNGPPPLSPQAAEAMARLDLQTQQQVKAHHADDLHEGPDHWWQIGLALMGMPVEFGNGSDGDLHITALEYHSTPAYEPRRIPTLIVAHRDRIIAVSHAYTLEPKDLYTDPDRSTEVPRGFVLKDRGESFALDCDAQGRLLERVDILSNVGSVQKKILDLFGIRSFSYIFEEKTRCTVRSPEVSGTFQGRGVLEVMVSE